MKLTVFMHSGERYDIEAENYDPVDMNDKRNDDTLNSILIGDYSLSRINIRDIVPFEEPTQGENPVNEENQEKIPIEN